MNDNDTLLWMPRWQLALFTEGYQYDKSKPRCSGMPLELQPNVTQKWNWLRHQ